MRETIKINKYTMMTHSMTENWWLDTKMLNNDIEVLIIELSKKQW